MKKYLAILVSFIAFTAACKNETSINQDDASEVIIAYLETHPEYKAVSFDFGEIKFNSRKDRDELNKYKALADDGLVKMEVSEQKKKFLSKDSTLVYQIILTDKAAPYVLDQRKDRATVKAINYVLDDSKPVNFVKTNDKTAKVTVSLKKEETGFYPFMQKADKNSDFLTKTYKLRLRKEKGWEIVN